MKTILVVDDEPGFVDMLKLTLEYAGYRVLTAPNGVDGFNAAVRQKPDLIITDVLMPVMDGFHFYKALKADERSESIPVIILTARGRMKETFSVSGADAFLEKPSQSAVLLKKIKELLTPLPRGHLSKRVLIGGIHPRIVGSISGHFTRSGCQTKAVTGGPDVLIQSVLFAPQIIIMDLQMGGPSGSSAQIIRAVRLLPQLKPTPILLYSYIDAAELGLYDVRRKANLVETHRKFCLSAGATEYLGPYEESSFFGKIKPFLG